LNSGTPAMQFHVIATDPFFPEHNCGIGLYAPDEDTAITGAFECLTTATLADGLFVPLPDQQHLGPTTGMYLFTWYDDEIKQTRMFSLGAINAEHAVAQVEALQETGRLIVSAEPA